MQRNLIPNVQYKIISVLQGVYAKEAAAKLALKYKIPVEIIEFLMDDNLQISEMMGEINIMIDLINDLQRSLKNMWTEMVLKYSNSKCEVCTEAMKITNNVLNKNVSDWKKIRNKKRQDDWEMFQFAI